MEIKRLLTNICTKNLEESKQFYISLFALKVSFDSDWFVHLISEGSELELGLVSTSHEIVPKQARNKISGVYLTFVVEDVDALHEKAVALKLNIEQTPEDTFYGQRRMLIIAPEGTVCDISSLT